MASKNETVADVAKKMRRNEEVFHLLYWCEYADRAEAAHKREVAELRECLKEAVDFVCEKSHRDCGRCVREGRFDCPGEKWRKALEGANHEC